MTISEEPSSGLTRRGVIAGALLGISMPAILAASSLGDQNKLSRRFSSSTSAVKELVVATAVSPWLPAYRAVTQMYEKESGVKITLREFPFAGLLTQQINAIQQKSNAFDIFQINEGWVGQFYSQGWIQKLNDIDPNFKWPVGLAEIDGIGRWDSSTNQSNVHGDIYGLPINGNVQLLVYRKDLYQKLGLSVPNTFKEAMANGKLAQKEKIARYGYVARGQGSAGGYAVTFDFEAVLHGNGVEWFAKPGKDWTPTITSAAAIASLDQYKQLLALGPVQPQTIDQNGTIAAIQSGDALQGHMVAGVVPQLEDPTKSSVAGKLGYAIMPSGTKRRSAMSGGWTLGVPVGADKAHAKASLDFMNWLVSKKIMTTWGKNGGVITRSDVLRTLGASGKHPDLAALSKSLRVEHQGIRYSFANDMIASSEVNLNRVIAGQIDSKTGLTAIANDMRKIVKAAGL